MTTERPKRASDAHARANVIILRGGYELPINFYTDWGLTDFRRAMTSFLGDEDIRERVGDPDRFIARLAEKAPPDRIGTKIITEDDPQCMVVDAMSGEVAHLPRDYQITQGMLSREWRATVMAAAKLGAAWTKDSRDEE